MRSRMAHNGSAKALTPKQRRFVEEYLVDLNATQAAIRARYSERTAQEQGSRLLSYGADCGRQRDGRAIEADKDHR